MNSVKPKEELEDLDPQVPVINGKHSRSKDDPNEILLGDDDMEEDEWDKEYEDETDEGEGLE